MWRLERFQESLCKLFYAFYLEMADSRKNRTRRNRKQNGGSGFMDMPSTGQVGGAKLPAVGSKSQVFHGNAKHTSGGLTRKDLMKTKNGRIVSRKKHAAGKKAIKNLRKLGYIAKKGKFTLFTKKSKRGGSGSLMDLVGGIPH
jgi:hypothetical protein